MLDLELERIDRENLWHAFTQMADYQPLIIDHARGVWLYDTQGRKLLDGVSSMWCNVHGHCHPVIDQAIRDQLARVSHVTSLGMSNPTTIALTERLVQCSPQGLECVFFSSDGASSVEVALKMAFQFWRQCAAPEPQRDLYLAVGNAYHGDTLGGVSVGGVSRFHAMFAPLLFDVVRGPSPDRNQLPPELSEEQACDYYLQQYSDLFARFGDRIAAVIIEPLVQGAAGIIIQPNGFLKGLRKLANQYGCLLIADEIAVGMGRTGKLWACEWEDVEPDFLCTGKGLSGGYLPVSATLTTRPVWNAFLGEYRDSKSFFHGHTFGGNPLGCSACLAALDLFEQERTLDNVLVQSDYLVSRLTELGHHQQVGQIRAKGLMAAVELVKHKPSNAPYPWEDRMGHRVCQAALDYGLWLRPLGNVIVIMPPLSIQKPEIDHLVSGLARAIERVFPVK